MQYSKSEPSTNSSSICSSSAYISSTYLKVILQGNQDLVTALMQTPNFDINKILEEDYIAGEIIIEAFEFMAQQGVESWLISYGQSIGVTAHGPMGYAMLSAPDLHTSLTVLADYSVVRSSLSSFEFSYSDTQAQIKLVDNTNHALSQRWILENLVYTTLGQIESIITHPVGNNAQISFAWPAPNYAEELEDLFGVKCQFDADVTTLSIPSSWCSIMSPFYDEHSFQSNLTKCRELKLKLASFDNLAISVKLHLQHYFDQRLAGLATAQELPTLENLAELHFMSPRTFNRRLGKYESNYRALLEEVRRDHAINLLSSTHLTASKISYYLAYREPANFNRAFKRWFATTPAAWRANRQTQN